jgi:hypothetical protein
MRFMMLMIPAVYREALPPDAIPPVEAVEAMGRFNQDMVDAGVMLQGEGLTPPSAGQRVVFTGGKSSVIDGPFTESKELLGGFWIIQVNSQQEALEWARKCPAFDGDIIEIRRIPEMEDFPEDVREAAKLEGLPA